MPHPLVLRRGLADQPGPAPANAYLAGLQRPFVPERQMTRGRRYVERLLHGLGRARALAVAEVAERYADAMAVPFVAHSAAEYYRWVVRCQLRPDGRRFAGACGRPIAVPVLLPAGRARPPVAAVQHRAAPAA